MISIVKILRRRKDAAFSVQVILFSVFCFLYGGCGPAQHKDTYLLMGTYVEVTSSDPRAGEVVASTVKELEGVLSLYDSQSELSKLNASYGRIFTPSDALLSVLLLSQEIYEMTGGSFDVSHGALYLFWKERIEQGSLQELPSSQEIARLRRSGGMDSVAIDRYNKRVILERKGMLLDLGGIAKGFIVDQAIERLKEEGITSALINAGGDMYCLGINQGKPWQVGLRDPQSKKAVLRVQELHNQAVATSGDYEQFFTLAGEEERYSHIINPKTGYPVHDGIVSVSVIARSCAVADSLATGLFVMGLDQIKKFVKESPLAVEVFVVTLEEGEQKLFHFKKD